MSEEVILAGWEYRRGSARLTGHWRRSPAGLRSTLRGQFRRITISFQIFKSLTNTKVIPIGVDPSEAFKSKLKFQIQHEVFRLESRRSSSSR